MSLSISMPEKPVLKPKIVVFGVGGGGCNAVNNMIENGLEGVDFVVANTDAQSLEQNHAERCIQMGIKKTQGLGAGSSPEIGAEAAEEVLGDISDAIHGAHLVFVTAGMGGGTGTGAAPIVSRVAKEMGALTVGVVTKPFLYEGNRRMRVAEAGIKEMEDYIDTLLVIPNQNLFRIAGEDTAFTEAFMMADRVLLGAVGGITNLMVRPGVINLDFADVRTVMGEMGKAMIGTGEASGEGRAIKAAEQALNNPLLDDISMKGARGVLISISASNSMKLYEVEEAMQRIRSEVDEDAQIIPGTAIDESLGDMLKVSVVATGIGEQTNFATQPVAGIGSEAPQDLGAQDIGVQGAEIQAAETQATAAAVMQAQHEEKRVFQVVSPTEPMENEKPVVLNVPFATPTTTAEVSATDVAATEVSAADVSAEVSTDTPADTPAIASSAPEKQEYAVGGIYPFTPPNSNVSNERAPLVPPQTAAADPAPKGLFGRLKAKLRRVADEDRNREVVPARTALPTASPLAPPPPLAAPLAPPASFVPPGLEPKAPVSDQDEEQLEIPSFLKSQAN